MQGLIVFVVIVLISAGIGAVSQVLKNQQQAEQARAARARARTRNQRMERDDDDRDDRDESDGRRRDAVGARNQRAKLIAFLKRLNDFAKKERAANPSLAPPSRRQPVPVARPARPLRHLQQLRRLLAPPTIAASPRRNKNVKPTPKATEAKRRAETQAERPCQPHVNPTLRQHQGCHSVRCFLQVLARPIQSPKVRSLVLSLRQQRAAHNRPSSRIVLSPCSARRTVWQRRSS